MREESRSLLETGQSENPRDNRGEPTAADGVPPEEEMAVVPPAHRVRAEHAVRRRGGTEPGAARTGEEMRRPPRQRREREESPVTHRGEGALEPEPEEPDHIEVQEQEREVGLHPRMREERPPPSLRWRVPRERRPRLQFGRHHGRPLHHLHEGEREEETERHPCSYRTAASAIRSQSVGKSIPIAAAACGTRLVPVIPGRVFASRQKSPSVGWSRKSMRAHPASFSA